MVTFSVTDIQHMIQAQLANPEFAAALLSSFQVKRLATLNEAGPQDLAFFFSKHYQKDLFETKAGVIVTGSAFIQQIEAAGVPAWKKSIFLACDHPNQAMALLASKFSSLSSSHDHQKSLLTESIIHPTAVLGANVKVGMGVEIGAYAVIEADSMIDDYAVIYPHAFIGRGCVVGQSSVLFPRVTLYEKTIIGKRCRIHAGVVIGADGFGYIPVKDPATQKPTDHQKIYHLGNVIIDDDVEIGSNTTIDRGTLGSTHIHSKAKIDNLVQVGHNCTVGEGAILCGTAGMAGSSSLGKFVTVAANSGTANQVHIGDYSFLAAYTGAAKSCEPESELGGVPARPLDEYYKILAIQNKLLRERGRKK